MFSTLLSIPFVIVFYMVFALLSFSFLITFPFILLALVAIILTASAVIVLQSLVKTGPFSASKFPGRLLASFANRVREYTQTGFTIFWFLTNFLLSWPAFMIYLWLSLLLSVGNAIGLISVLSYFRVIIRRVFNAVRDIIKVVGNRLRSLFPGSSLLQSLQSKVSINAWAVFDSSVSDLILGRLLDGSSRLRYTLHSISSIATLFIQGALLQPKTPPQNGNDPWNLIYLIPGMLLQLVYHIAGPFLYPFIAAHDQATAAEIHKLALSNSCSAIYDVLPLIADNNDQIRLMKILPGERSQPLKCQLYVENITNQHMDAFEALSYVWGRFDLKTVIQVNDKPFRVSSNLFSALVHLRDERKSRTMWIDALCVDQSNLEERGLQVLLMSKIYSSASRVVVWLGKKEHWGLESTISTWKHNEKATKGGAIHYSVTRVVSNLLRRPWWNRVWVVQELVLAKKATIQCGMSTIDWGSFCQLVDHINSHSRFPIHPTHMDNFQALRNNQSTSSCRKTDILSILYDFRSRYATDPRDKVFAFLGLADDHSYLVQPDYTRSTSDLSIELARQHIKRSGTLTAVAFVECARQLDQQELNYAGYSGIYVPSWCPAFMSENISGRNWQPFWTGGVSGTEMGFSAAGGLPIRSPKTLGSSLKIVDSLPENEYSLTIEVVSGLKSVVSNDGRLEGVDELVAQTKANLLWETVLPIWRNMSQEAIQANDAERLFHLTITAGRFSSIPEGSKQDYVDARRKACVGRRLFVTSTGHLGLGPDELQMSDEIHIAIGSQVPIILRKVGDAWPNRGYRYIGQAYVHELMVYDGNIEDDIEGGKVQLEERELV